MNPDDIAVNLIRLNGERIDCERLQWETNLLSRCGAVFELTFIYHHGGPYSFELAAGWENARADARISVKEEKTRHGTPYWVSFRNEDDEEAGSVDGLSCADARCILKKMAGDSDLVLELAAAFVFLKDEGHYGSQTIEELKTRKPLTTQAEDYVTRAHDLLTDLGLDASDLLTDRR